MNPFILAAILASSSAVSVWVSWSGRVWMSGAIATLAMGFWGWAIVRGMVLDSPTGWAIGVWIVVSGFYVAYAMRRNSVEHSRIEAELQEKRDRASSLEQSVAQARAQGAKTEVEQREALALYGMMKGLTEALSWDQARPRLEAAVQQYLGLEEFALYVADIHSPGTLRPLVTRRLVSSVGAGWDTLSRRLQEHGVALHVPALLDSPERAIVVPIRDSEELVGYLYARAPAGPQAQTLLAKGSSFAGEVSFAFRRVKLFQEIERLSQIDGLTGVYRRGVLDQRLEEEVLRARTFKTTFCLMLLDIDHFKRINDTYGHPFGDQVLRRMGEILRDSVYETDLVARYGGEEFALMLPRADPAGVLRKAQAILAAVESEAFTLAMETVRVTVSIGLAHFPRDGAAAEFIVQQADQALYYAKESGRNRVIDIAQVPLGRTHGRKSA